MPLSSESRRKVFLYFGVPQVTAVGGVPGAPQLVVSPGTDKLVTALDRLTADGELTVVQLLVILDLKWTDLAGVSDSLQVRKAGAIELRGDELDARRQAFNFFLGSLDATLFPEGMGILGDAGGLQGPYCEP